MLVEPEVLLFCVVVLLFVELVLLVFVVPELLDEPLPVVSLLPDDVPVPGL